VCCVLTKAGAEFVTPLSVAALSENKVFQDLFSLTDESEMGHIRLSREADLVVVAPCTADLMARMAAGMANDLASTVLLATDKPVLIAPTMNSMMWAHPATQDNLETLQRRGVQVVQPNAGDLACGEVGTGRMAEVPQLIAAIEGFFQAQTYRPLAGRRALVTSGPTHEPIDPVRMIANRSSGKQGHAIAAALQALGAEVTLVSGPVALSPPPGVQVVKIETARQMLAACQEAQARSQAERGQPLDIAVCAAAVADWGVDGVASQKMKKTEGGAPPQILLCPNPDILATLAQSPNQRPTLVVGFAAETEKVLEHARAKLVRKRCDWICANDVSPTSGTFGGDATTLHLVRADGVETWPQASKVEAAQKLAAEIATHFAAAPAAAPQEV
jgi:phosphopantothenoylcysteine decarboxylase/phosphopantothenate--cysteine ligase